MANVRIPAALDRAGTKTISTSRVFPSFDEAAGHALTLAISGHSDVVIDVVVWDEDAARAFGGDDAVNEYREDPDASVFRRIQITANDLGRVP